MYPFLFQHAVHVKSLLSLEELSSIIESFSQIKSDDKNYLYPFLSEIENLLKTEKPVLTTYVNLWDALIGFNCTETNSKVRPIIKQLASFYSTSKEDIEFHSLIRICLGASKVKCNSIGFWSMFYLYHNRKGNSFIK